MESESRDPFIVDTDVKAEWAIRKIKDLRAEHDRLVKVCREAIAEYQTKILHYDDAAARDEEYFAAQLAAYFQTVPHKATKTQEKYELPSGSLVLRQKPPVWNRSDSLVEELQAKALDAFLKTEPTVKWAELKDRLQVLDGTVSYVTDDGELIALESVTVTPGEAVFEVKA